MPLSMYRPLLHIQRRLLKRFGKRRVGMERQGNVLGTPAVGHDRHRLGDHVRGPGTDDKDKSSPD